MKGQKRKANKIDAKLGYSQTIYTDPSKYYEAFKVDKAVKFNENQHPFINNTKVADIVLAGRGFEEDSIYEQFTYYRNNIRRGNTLIKIGNDIFWLRKGLKKFFDIRLEYLSGGLKGNHSHYATFRQIQNVLSCKDLVDQKDQPICHVWKLLKANGENCQVSYCRQLGMWSISSKNVSIVVKDSKDLDKYKQQRYNFAVLIARCFFRILETNNYSPAQLEQFTNYLANRTMIGQYCGNPQCQHIVKYEQQTILFYAIVDHSSEDTCIPPSQSGNAFKTFKLPTTNDFDKVLVGKYTTFTDLMNSLTVLFEQVASSKLDSDEQGCVIYFGLEITQGFYKEAKQRKLGDRFPIPQKCNPINLKVSSLGKLKTLEYRILRKLRQKLKHYTANPQKYQDNLNSSLKYTFTKFVKESKDLIKNTELKTPFQYYKLLTLVSLQYIENNFKNVGAFDLMRTAYIDYLNVIMYSIQNNIEPTYEMMTDSDLIIKLRKTPWVQYNTNVIEQFEKAITMFYPNYKKIQEAKQIQKQGSSSQQDVDRQ